MIQKNRLKNYFADLNLKEILEFTIFPAILTGEFMSKQSFTSTKIVGLICIG